MKDQTHPASLPRLLVVDDQPSNITILHAIFEKDFRIFMATDAQSALHSCQAHPPYLILLDAEMPGVNGYMLCEQLKLNPDLKTYPSSSSPAMAIQSPKSSLSRSALSI